MIVVRSMAEVFETAEHTLDVERAIQIIVEADEETIQMLSPLYRKRAEEIRERFGDKEEAS